MVLTNNDKNERETLLILLTTNFMIMKMENEMKYVAPEVEVLEIEVEAGFEGSSDVPAGGENPF